MKNGDTNAISDALKKFGDQDSAAKWFGHLNTKSDGSSVISDSVTNGTFQNSDMADLIQQFPELSNASGDLKDNLQDLAMDKGAEAIGKIRDSVKDVTDPKQLAQADKYVQSIMDTMEQD